MRADVSKPYQYIKHPEKVVRRESCVSSGNLANCFACGILDIPRLKLVEMGDIAERKIILKHP